MDFSRILTQLDLTKQAIADNNHDNAEDFGKCLCDVYEEDFNLESEKDFTPEVARIQFDVLKTILDIHIMRGDPLDISIRAGQLWKRYKETREHFPQWADKDWEPIDDIIYRSYLATNVFYYRETIGSIPPKQLRTPECRCLLCGKNKANKTGSHMVPHLLIGDVFSYDGSTDREKVVAEESSLAGGEKSRYFGHEVYDDTVQNLMGRSFTDEEIEKEIAKKNILTRDYYFCEECEKRFGVIESYYAEILSGLIKDYPPQIPYLFWLSVAWRMSIGGMGFKMDEAHDEKLRSILDKCLALKRDDILVQQSKLGYCAYLIGKAEDTRDETLGILAFHTPTKPYMALIGKRLFRLFTSKSTAISFCKRKGWAVEELNFGDAPEKVGALSFLDFWFAKRAILDANWEDERNIWNWGAERNKTVARYEAGNGEEDQGFPNWLNTTNDRIMMEPRAIRKIREWIEAHSGDYTIEELCSGTGYTPEEIYNFLHYWEGKNKEIEEKQKRTQRIAPFLEELLEKELRQTPEKVRTSAS